MHEPVLLNEVLDLLCLKPGGTYIDGTAGRGGHAVAMLRHMGPRGHLLAIDRDPEAAARLRDRFAGGECGCVVEQGAFSEMAALAARHGIACADGILLDLGVSSDQLDTPERGFSFMADGPLDMRMDPSRGESAADVVNGESEAELTRILREWGEEPAARRVARRIVEERRREPITSTGRLVRIVESVSGRTGRVHPATRVFQALRICVNRELEELREGLDAALKLLAPGGRLAVISFHSLEDRIVKRCFVEHAGRWESLPGGGRCRHVQQPEIRRVTRKPVRPGEEEMRRNPRSRSAKLRVVERNVSDGSQE